MYTLQNFVFFEGADANAISDNEMQVTNRSSQFIVQVSGGAVGLNLEIQGYSDVKANAWVPLACINLTSFDVTTSIGGDGIYAVPADGISKCRAEIKAINGGVCNCFTKAGE